MGLVIHRFRLIRAIITTEEEDQSSGTETTCGQPMIQQYIRELFPHKKSIDRLENEETWYRIIKS
jgi:hypothetical protein